uniref:SUPEROXIDE REDUCTASE n=1 Tax=Archaeoglobus fulgidus TaxID=2234 RepID=UPI000436DEFA|nr:Chain A, SUPEROXIDE REDUCTASE [Archaeoglobus fulgidus]4BFK_B Chain B, SUPEROXIDE REDUCTASE [Archaeoglobus fulgidus]4BFK_C Chain C, SUPEROXIDE REDUCTASE [Archaeoglobus fulgidus]4BFK_D Chain D, SUPEROXIDE REDUCTASE [Archaeoglobus fulgidus]4C4U_A Chain A, SUPEROXIDE REDUCTASE [Archaeoglobus fulgidus]4C4U_B Chain B, SUPEROXIDE REDUCTASE [Archaeoglobus fulgidus]4C4U_C Chain C, SUPEROXIDE REDUCTASE [Archaeoglobus fulgidus]4C4U_D Chain D, SUPEROXIDE REDUCTASE [Archaeoglobus fulgidus]4C4U_E Chai
MELFQTADWKKQKHVPVIEVLRAEGGVVEVKVSVGKEIPHPNTTEHHIAWIELVFQPEGSKFPYVVGRAEFAAHGASVDGPNTSGVYTDPVAVFAFKAEKSGKLTAFSYCNIHGLWMGEATLSLE